MTNSPARILVTDDDPLALKAATRLLTSAGYEVISAINGEQTLRLVKEHHPDVLLLDVVLPDIEGTEICRRIKADVRTADIFVILLSGLRTSSDEQSQGMEGGADGYIVRPIANRELLARIQAYLRVKTAEQRAKEYSRHLEEVVAELKRAEVELRLHGEIVENMAEGILLIRTSDEVIVYTNPAIEQIFGYPSRELVGKQISAINAPTDKSPEEVAREIIQNLNATGVWRGEVQNLKKDGTAFWCYANVSTFEHPQYGNVWVSIHKDITERKQLETEIQDALEYAENIVETVREPLVVLNSELKILTANHSFYDTFKVTPEETIGNFIYDLGNRQWDIPKLRVLFEEIIPHDTVFNGYEVEHDFPDIGRKTILLNARQIFRENIGSHIILLAMEDITERKQLETEIQDALEYAENIVETVREPLVVLNSELKILTANHSFYDTFKVTPEETIGNFIYDLGNRQWDIPKLRVLFEKIIPHDTVFNGYEVEHDFPDIGRKTILLNARQIFREKIGSHIILLAMEDITVRKQLETEIQDALEYAENIVETVREPLVVLNSELKILTANHSFYDTFKVTPEETIGNFIYDLGNRQWDIPKLRVLFEKILPHDAVFNGYEVEHDFPDIGRKTILLNARQIFRENIGSHIILLAMEDITVRKQLETEIQDALEYAENIVETVREPLVVLNSELKILTANHSFYDTFKVTPEETIGNFIYDLGNRQWDIPKLRVLFEKILPHDAVFNGYEVEHDFPDIGRKTILLNARQIFRENIGSHIILLAMEDITERKRAEQQLATYAEKLEEIVEQRTRELHDAQEQLVRHEKLAVLGQMASSVGHELRNPLSVMTSAIYYLKLIQPNADAKVKEYLGIIDQEVHTSEKIITDLLDFARVKSVEREAVSVSNLIRQTLERFPAPPTVEVTIETSDDLPPAFVDVRQMIQVLGNLTLNACQAMKDGGRLSLSSNVQNDMINIMVKDSGVGISPENMKKLFEPLFTTKTKGIGLGLAVSRKLIEANGGRIEAQSEAGKGSTFTLYLPQYSTKAEA